MTGYSYDELSRRGSYMRAGTYRPQSIAFVDRYTFEVSVFVADLTDPETVLRGHPDDSLVAFRVEIPRSAGGIVACTPENPDASHRVICYPNPSRMRAAGKLIAERGAMDQVYPTGFFIDSTP